MTFRQDEFDAAIAQWLNYKAALAGARSLQQSGLAIPNTSGSDFVSTINAASRRMINALDIKDPERCEAVGELLLNASRNMTQDQGTHNVLW